jgi:hypothetical protein
MKLIRMRYVLILNSMLMLALLWEFWLENVVIDYFLPGAALESLVTRGEYVITVFVFCVLSCMYPYVHACRLERARKKSERERELLITQLQDALAEIKTLRGMISICSSCKKIREDKDVWTQLEAYLYAHSEATFSHGFCPDCFKIQMSTIEQGPDSDKH